MSTPDQGRRRPLVARDHGLALACLAGAAIFYTWPLAADLRGSIPGLSRLTDVTEYVWLVGWMQYALTHHVFPLKTGWLLVPFESELRLGTFCFLQALAAFPLTGPLGIIGAYNTVLIGTLFLNGASAYWLIYLLVRRIAPALLASAAFMLSVAVVWHFVAGRLALPSLWIVVCALILLRALALQPEFWKGILLGCALLAALLSDFQIVLFTALWLAVYFLYLLGTLGRAIFTLKFMTASLIALLIFAVPFLLIYFPALVNARSAGYPVPTLEDAAFYSFRLVDFTDLHDIPFIYGFDFLLAAVAAIALLWRRVEIRFWLAGALFFFVLALGPYLQPTLLPMPFALIKLAPALTQFRTPYRFVMPAQIGLAVTSGFVLEHMLARVSRRTLQAGITAVLFAARVWYTPWVQPFAVQTYPEYAFYHQLASQAGDFSLIEVPFGIRSGLQRIGDGGEAFQYYQHVHGKRLLNGSMARVPSHVFEFYRSHPALLFLAGEPSTSPLDLEQDFADVLAWSNTHYVVVHLSYLRPGQAAGILAFLDGQPALQRLPPEQDIIVYRVTGQPGSFRGRPEWRPY